MFCTFCSGWIQTEQCVPVMFKEDWERSVLVLDDLYPVFKVLPCHLEKPKTLLGFNNHDDHDVNNIDWFMVTLADFKISLLELMQSNP